LKGHESGLPARGETSCRQVESCGMVLALIHSDFGSKGISKICRGLQKSKPNGTCFNEFLA
jgi:hypothetical protein